MGNHLLTVLAGMVGMASLALLPASAQDGSQQAPPLPIDKEVRMGKLDNGLTYFIRHNEKPKDRAHFYISQRVGSVLEEESQRGLAHFLEHMAFQGSKNFPDKGMIDYLEKNGVKFGSNLNAYTAIDETVYQIMNAPTTNQNFVDSCLLILHDWSGYLDLTDEEIDKERGVIQEEWRTRDNGSMHALEKLLQEAFPEGHRYGNRLPIGKMDVVMNFPYDALRSYYHKWYRPDLQAIIVVGDIDVDHVEKTIKETFSHIPMPENPAERVYFDVPDRPQPKGVVITNPEVPTTQIGIALTYDAMPQEIKGTAVGFLTDFISHVISELFDNRFSEILEKPNAPFLRANVGTGPFIVAQTEEAFQVDIMAEEGGYARALQAVTAELKRAAQYGFTEGEYKRVIKEILSDYDNMVKEKKNRTNAQYAQEYSSYFTTGGYIPGVETEAALAQQMSQILNVEMINKQLQQMIPMEAGENFFIYIMAVEKDGIQYPTGDELVQEYNKGMQAEVEPYKETVSSEDLMDQLPQPGSIVSEQKDQALGSTKWELSNGIDVYLLPTDYEANNIRISGVSPGGTVKLDRHDINVRAANDFATVGGYGTHTPNEIDKILTGRKVSFSSSLTQTSERVGGSSAKADVEQLFQGIYLASTSIRKDTALFRASQEKTIAMMEAAKSNPTSTVMRDSIPALLYGGNELAIPLTIEQIKQLDYDKMLDAYRERFSDMGDFTFFIVGDFTPDSIKPLVAQYIASLPNTSRGDTWEREKTLGMTKQSRTTHFTYEVSTPSVIVVDMLLKGNSSHNLKDNLISDILSSILDQQYLVSIREEEGGTYGVSAMGGEEKYPTPISRMMIVFQTNKEQAEHLNQKIKDEMKEMAEKGVKKEFFEKAVLNLKKQYDENLRKNGYWMGHLQDIILESQDFHSQFVETLDSITMEDVRLYLAGLLKDNTYLEMIAIGEPAAEQATAEKPAA